MTNSRNSRYGSIMAVVLLAVATTQSVAVAHGTYHTAASAFHGRVLRYDIQGVFTNSASWTAFDAGNTAGLQTQGYVGAVSDGRYIYFAPYSSGSGFSGNVLRFDSQLPRAIPPTV